jgi:hypothetical protein
MTETTAAPTPYVRPDVRGFLDYLNAMPGPRTHQMTPEAARQVFTAMKDVADLPVGELAVLRDLSIPGPGGSIPARLFDARDTRQPGPALVFYHGGGFVIGNIDTHAGFCAEMARVLDVPVVSVDYRLAPEHRWPAAPDDCEAAARWVAESPTELGRSVTGLILCGDSGERCPWTHVDRQHGESALGLRSFDVGKSFGHGGRVWLDACCSNRVETQIPFRDHGLTPRCFAKPGVDPFLNQRDLWCWNRRLFGGHAGLVVWIGD